MPISKRCITSLVMLLMTVLPATGSSLLTVLPARAQAQDTRKAEADELLHQGIEQFQTSQFEAALQSWQQALALYRAIKDRQGEGWALGNLGNAYQSPGNYAKAINYAQQVLAIAREIKDRQSEAKALGNLGIAYYSHDGLLTADDLLALTQRLHAELVVLSACDTGRGKITGDGVIGLSRALLYAGAPNVVVSLWKVPDAPTAALMQAFYTQWLNDPAHNKARALRRAMLNTRKTYPAPLSWAAFTLIGVAK